VKRLTTLGKAVIAIALLAVAVERRAASIDVPPLDDPQLALRGLAHFRARCVDCHGAPGVAPAPFALGLTPVPSNLAYGAQHWQPAALFWIIKYGIKMAGMPAWEFRLTDEEIWATVAFLRTLPTLSPRAYQSLQAPEPRRTPPAADGAPDASRGAYAIGQYACSTCHRIPGIVGPNAPVGPPLDGIATRSIIAGVLPNTPDNMRRFLREPQQVKPGGAMPDLGVGERDARDIAAYLYMLD
jgi:mono/diheme cytochrome c family protein